jgi:hypothetical protein
MISDTLHSWGKSGDVTCGPTGGSCARAQFLDAEVSGFYTETLKDVSTRMQAILNEIGPDADGRELCFLNTRRGVLLAWAVERDVMPASSITADSSFEEITEALGLISREGAAVRT